MVQTLQSFVKMQISTQTKIMLTTMMKMQRHRKIVLHMILKKQLPRIKIMVQIFAKKM